MGSHELRAVNIVPMTDRPLCVICEAPLSPPTAKKYTGRDPECGGFASQIHVGFVRNGVTCRYFDPDDNPVSTWQEVSAKMKLKSTRRR